MLLFLSDLHLADASSPAVPLDRLVARCQRHRRSSRQGRPWRPRHTAGDIFEILKSDVWLESDPRPWDTDWTCAHDAIVDRIVDRILVRLSPAAFDPNLQLRVDCNDSVLSRLQLTTRPEFRVTAIVQYAVRPDEPQATVSLIRRDEPGAPPRAYAEANA